jgi:hypothetical protein
VRLTIWNTLRMVRCYEEDLDRLHLPRGLLEDAIKVVEAAGSRLEIEDRRPAVPTHPVSFTGELSPAQEDAVAALPADELGVLVALPGAGETVVACALIARLGVATLVLVRTWPLAESGDNASETSSTCRGGTSASSVPGERGAAASSSSTSATTCRQ